MLLTTHFLVCHKRCGNVEHSSTKPETMQFDAPSHCSLTYPANCMYTCTSVLFESWTLTWHSNSDTCTLAQHVYYVPNNDLHVYTSLTHCILSGLSSWPSPTPQSTIWNTVHKVWRTCARGSRWWWPPFTCSTLPPSLPPSAHFHLFTLEASLCKGGRNRAEGESWLRICPVCLAVQERGGLDYNYGIVTSSPDFPLKAWGRGYMYLVHKANNAYLVSVVDLLKTLYM